MTQLKRLSQELLAEANQRNCEFLFLRRLSREVRKAEEFCAEYMASKKAKEVK